MCFLMNLNYEKVFNYGLVGVITTVIYFVLIYSMVDFFRFPVMHSSVATFIIVAYLSFVANYKYTFNSDNHYTKTFVKYLVVVTFGLCTNITVVYVGTEYFALHYLVAQMLIIIIVPMQNYFFNIIWVFRVGENKEQDL